MSIIDLFLPTSKFTPFGLPCKKCTLIFLLIFPFLDGNKALPHSPESAGETLQEERVLLPDFSMLTGRLPQHVTFCSTRLLERS